MIIDSVEHAANYEKLSPAFAAAMRFLREHMDVDLADGRYEIADGVYANVKRYETKPVENAKYEAHKNYADVQYLAKGREYMGWAPVERMELYEYNAEKDVYKVSGEGGLYPLTEGTFAIVFPEDAHMPNVAMDAPCAAVKMILKVRV